MPEETKDAGDKHRGNERGDSRFSPAVEGIML